MIEIERRFELKSVSTDIINQARDHYNIRQGYIETVSKTAVRVRITDSQAFLTIKTPCQGIGKAEFEYEIPVSDAEELFTHCEFSISKTRYEIPYNGYLVELDIFKGANEGLIIAEIEFPTEADAMMASIPDWVEAGLEVTDNYNYSNMFLATSPIKTWKKLKS